MSDGEDKGGEGGGQVDSQEYLSDQELLAARKAMCLDGAVPWQWKKAADKVTSLPFPLPLLTLPFSPPSPPIISPL